ncbi:hypothetical protein PsalN5692_01331 [Piscirickettsia salmonis]|uniref:hypothetical protein n=1 Tax=Piscirickettsia salmonis TaxID=1238 RepID=UPI0012B8E9D6|nr:hypothetical protein [Piscirickettsia salmonis]QGP49876.1 hypothetical protein PsalN5692_01331 [Piscirickettsia salmonis]QGP55062.1 hypothetical protein PsalSR1_02505 [Piscirickettsia salmonis]QGP59071.1 hypothetical protein PsalBI1_01656 [Piscirickettsia salmonis]QGP64629.1 hypothetical protein PsalMR5_02506 [Piscirickettsia salmonis]
MSYNFKGYLEELSKCCYQVIADPDADADLVDENKTLLIKITDAEEVYDSFLSLNEANVTKTLTVNEDPNEALYSTFAVWLLAEKKKRGHLDLAEDHENIASLLAGIQPIELKQTHFLDNAFEMVYMFERELLQLEL